MRAIAIRYTQPKFTKPEQRQHFAELAAQMFIGRDGFQPYRPTETDWDFWTIDRANDWKLKFINDHLVEVRHRYGDANALPALAGWFAYSTGGEVSA